MDRLTKSLIAASCLVLSVVPVVAQTVPIKPTNVTATKVAVTIAKPVSDMRPTSVAANGPVQRVIIVSLEDRRLALVEDGAVKKVYRVAVGKQTTPSPTGTFTVVARVENPTYYHEGQVIPPGPDNPVGTRWIGLDRKGYGIHGTNLPRSVGKAASHGCIRMRQHDLEELFAAVRGGDQVEIIGERNDETAAIFGDPLMPAPAAAAVPIVTAQLTPDSSSPTADGAVTAILPAAVPVSQ